MWTKCTWCWLALQHGSSFFSRSFRRTMITGLAKTPAESTVKVNFQSQCLCSNTKSQGKKRAAAYRLQIEKSFGLGAPIVLDSAANFAAGSAFFIYLFIDFSLLYYPTLEAFFNMPRFFFLTPAAGSTVLHTCSVWYGCFFPSHSIFGRV